MCAQWMKAQYYGHGKAADRSVRSTLRRPWLISSIFVLTLAIFFLLFQASPVQAVHRWFSPKKIIKPDIYRNEPDHPGIFDWQTRSSFDPVRIPNTADKSVQELCNAFPVDLLDEIQPVLKTGQGVLDERVGPQLQSVSACLTNLLIVSDANESYEGHEIIDVLADIPEDLSKRPKDLKPWRDGSLAAGTATSEAGWTADRFKFIPAATRAWKMRPGRKWYVLYEADTYIVWDNVFRLLANFDPNLPYYFGSPTLGREKTFFANGGPGIILSREAMRRLTSDDFNHTTGHYIGANLLRRYWDVLVDDCCGDSVLGWALWGQNVTMGGLWPMFNPHSPHGIPFSDRFWCQPIVTMHKPAEEDLIGLWRWQWENRVFDRPLLYRDLAMSYFNMSTLTTREDWKNADWDGFEPPVRSTFYTHDPHASFDACGEACKAHEECFQWNYHLQKCRFARSIRMGSAEEPGLGENRKKKLHFWQSENDWPPEDLRWMAGWDTAKIAKWMDERPCHEPRWVKPSTKRI